MPYGARTFLTTPVRGNITRGQLFPSIHPSMRYYMNTLTFKGNWNEIAGKLKQQYANLTDDDVLFKEGKEEELLGRL
jgi:hypothetical protein